MSQPEQGGNRPTDRRDFLKSSAAATAAAASARGASPAESRTPDDKLLLLDDFRRGDSLAVGDAWESLNPGYWCIRQHALRRKLHNVGDRRPGAQFPWHWETHKRPPVPADYDPSLPLGMLWRRDWKLAGNFSIRVEGRLLDIPRAKSGSKFAQDQPGYGLIGVCFGGRALHESWEGGAERGDAAWFAAWRDDNSFGVYDHAAAALVAVDKAAQLRRAPLEVGKPFAIEIEVTGDDPQRGLLTARLTSGNREFVVRVPNVERKKFLEGYVGLVCRGLLDFQIERVLLDPGENKPLDTPLNELHVCYPLGDTLALTAEGWKCQFIALFRNDGGRAQIRIADSPAPPKGWQDVPVAGSAPIVSNEFRCSTAVVDVVLPRPPHEATLYYTVWKDDRDVTADPRLQTASVGPGTGFVGAVPASGQYVGRLPRLVPPYRLCGLSCHAISENQPELPRAARFQENWLHDQPTADAYRPLEDYDFQVMLWEDDIWYLELIFPPPSTADAYKVIQATLGGPTTRWQMMRHWNVLNPGDHDYGMDDVKGPEQLAVRLHDDLGQDPRYMRRNFQLVGHLCQGDERPAGTDNPKRWRRWKMPAGDFSLLLVDGRLWRTSQDTQIWDDQGWGHHANVYDRRDPTRTLLGEEQFAWLSEIIRTDPAPLICVSGINALHPVWAGNIWQGNADRTQLGQRDRVAADLAGWVAAGAQRVIELLASRSGVVSVYGDVHAGCILKNVTQRLWECSFGPIGRYGGRALKADFARRMRDYENRALEVHALYHHQHHSPELAPPAKPIYWNFLEMHFDPRADDPMVELKLRNLVDAPQHAPRGGGSARVQASETGRPTTSRLPNVQTLAEADVLLVELDGRPVRGAKSNADGKLKLAGLVDVRPGVELLLVAIAGDRVDCQRVRTVAVERR